jgi:DNA-binding CsgD family transcriptional regulator
MMDHPMYTPCAEWAEKLAATHPDDLSPSDRAALDMHVASCPTCATVRAEYQAIDMLILDSSGIEPLPDLPIWLLQPRPKLIRSLGHETQPAFPRRQVLVAAAPNDPQAIGLVKALRLLGLNTTLAETVGLASLADEVAVCIIVLHPVTWCTTSSIMTAMRCNPHYMIPVLAEPMPLPSASWALEPISIKESLVETAQELETLISGYLQTVPEPESAFEAAADLAYLQSDDGGEALIQKSLLLYREVGDTRGIAFSLSRLAWVATRRGNFAAARSLIEESLALNRAVGDKDAIAWSLYFLADNASLQGEYSKGRTLLEESLGMFRELGDKRGIATALKQSALWLFVAQGDQALVRAQLEESRRLFRELGDKDGIAFCYWLSGWVALRQGDTSTAHALVRESLALWQEIGNRWYTAWSLGMLGKGAAHRRGLVAARALYEESLAILRVSNEKWLTAFCLEELAAVVKAQGVVVWAVRLWGAAESLRNTIGSPLPPVFHADYEHSVAAARAQLGEKAFTAAWAEGRTMTPQQVFSAREPATESTSTPARSLTSNPHELTAREVEVLRLVAQGLTNKQVAEQLFIARRTVNSHLTNIYGKIGVSSRSAANRYAVEHHLI